MRVLLVVMLMAVLPQVVSAKYLVKNSLNVKKDGKGAVITFTLQEPADVQVSIKKNGKIVRHLIAGLVGESESSEGLQKGLKQRLLWDGLDDFKKPVALSGIEVEVGAKLKADFDKIVGWDGNQLTTVRGVCFDLDGGLVAIGGEQLLGHRNSTIITRYKKTGEYLNQIFPPLGGLAAEDREGMPCVKLATGEEIPVVYHMETRATLPSAIFDYRVSPILSKDGKSIYVLSGTAKGLGGGISHLDVHEGRRILKLNVDGSVPKDYLGPVVAAEFENKIASAGEGSIALSADGKYMYVTGLYRNKTAKRWEKEKVLQQVVYKVSLVGPAAEVTVFCGVLKETGTDNMHLNDPQHVDVDAKGNVYVTDQGNGRVQVFSDKGIFIKSFVMEGVSSCGVHNPTGAIYLFSAKNGKIVKYKNLEAKTMAFEFPVKTKPWNRYQIEKVNAIDVDKYGPIARLSFLTLKWNDYQLTLLEDTGAGFSELKNPIKKKIVSKHALRFNRNACVTDKWILAQGYDHGGMAPSNIPEKYNKETGVREGKVTFETENKITVGVGTEYITGKDGFVYVQGGGYGKNAGKVLKYDQDFKQAKFGDKNFIDGLWHGHAGASGFFVGRNGHVYSIGMETYRNKNAKDKTMGMRLREYDEKGEPVSMHRVFEDGKVFLSGVVVDSKGNIYMGAMLSKEAYGIPEWFKGRLPKDTLHHYPSRNYMHYGNIVKFGPEGGSLESDPEGDYFGVKIHQHRGNVSIKGGKAIGKSLMVPMRGGKNGLHCFCESSRFDIDSYDRLVVPDLHQYAIRILDSDGRNILKIGSYGNMDNRGPESSRPEPAVAFNWLLRTVVDGDKIYAADANNRRVVVVKLSCEEYITGKL